MEKMIKIYEMLGISIEYETFDGIEGYCFQERNKKAYVIINSKLNRREKIKTLAHELCHIIMHFNEGYSMFQCTKEEMEMVEEEAKRFADGMINFLEGAVSYASA